MVVGGNGAKPFSHETERIHSIFLFMLFIVIATAQEADGVNLLQHGKSLEKLSQIKQQQELRRNTNGPAAHRNENKVNNTSNLGSSQNIPNFVRCKLRISSVGND